MRFLRVVLLILLILSFSLFVTQNYSLISVEFLNTKLTLPVFLLVLISAFIGFMISSLYLSFKLFTKTKRLSLIENLFDQFYRGYYSASSQITGHLMKEWEGAGVLHAESNFNIGNRAIDLEKIKKTKGLVEGYLGSLLVKVGNTQQAKELLESAIKKDEDNLLALKAYRDLCYIESNIEECISYQEKIIQKCEKWEREKQKAIFAELLCLQAQLKDELKERGKLLERAYEICKTPLVYSNYITFLLEIEDLKGVKKVINRVFKEGLQDEVFSIIANNEIALTKLLDTIEQNESLINPNVLVNLYIKLNMIGKLQHLEADLKDPVKTIVKMYISHTEEARLCKDILLKLYKPWECVCGVEYNLYMPFCEKCFRWGEISLRR